MIQLKKIIYNTPFTPTKQGFIKTCFNKPSFIICTKVDSSNLRSFESAIDSNVWSKLRDEVAERILELSVRNSDKPLSTYHKLSRTCSRFNILLQRRNRYLLPRVHLNFSDSDFKKLDKYNGKIKVSVRKIVKVFGEICGASLYISNVINEKKWKSA